MKNQNYHKDQFDKIVNQRISASDFAMPKPSTSIAKSIIQLTIVYLSALLILGIVLSSTLKSCAYEEQIRSEQAMAYQAQFQNANEHEVFVRRLGAK